MQVRAILGIILLFQCGCGGILFDPPSVEEKMVGKIVNRFIKEEKEENSLVVLGRGGAIPNKIKAIFLHLELPLQPTLEQARAIYIQMNQRLLELVNADEAIRPYLDNYPFQPDNIEILLSFRINNQHTPQPFIDFMHLTNGYLYYSQWDFENDKFINEVSEKYEPQVTLRSTWGSTSAAAAAAEDI